MPIHRIQGPDGKIHRIEAPKGANPERLTSFLSSSLAPKKEKEAAGFFGSLCLRVPRLLA